MHCLSEKGILRHRDNAHPASYLYCPPLCCACPRAVPALEGGRDGPRGGDVHLSSFHFYLHSHYQFLSCSCFDHDSRFNAKTTRQIMF